MGFSVIPFLPGGLSLGWALSANDAVNAFGTAVGNRMIRFATAAIVCGIFVVSGGGDAHTLGKLRAINALPGAFMAAFSAVFSVYLVTRVGIAVFTTHVVFGSIIGWSLFTGTPTDSSSLTKIDLAHCSPHAS